MSIGGARSSLNEFSEPLARLRDGLLQCLVGNGSGDTLDSAGLRAHLNELGLRNLIALAEAAITHSSDRFAAPDAVASEVEAGWQHSVTLHETQADPSDAKLVQIVALARRAPDEVG